MKNSSVYFLLLITFALNSGCKDEPTKDFITGGTIIQTDVQIRIVDKTGTDLLDPTTHNSLDRFKAYYFKGEENKISYCPYQIEKWPLESYYHLTIFLNSPPPERRGFSEWTTYLEFEDGTIATIKALFDVRPGYVVLDKASYNDVPVAAWDRSLNNGGQVTYELVIE